MAKFSSRASANLDDRKRVIDAGTLSLILFLGVLGYALVAGVLHTLSSYARRHIDAYDQVRKARELRRAYHRSVAQRGDG